MICLIFIHAYYVVIFAEKITPDTRRRIDLLFITNQKNLRSRSLNGQNS